MDGRASLPLFLLYKKTKTCTPIMTDEVQFMVISDVLIPNNEDEEVGVRMPECAFLKPKHIITCARYKSFYIFWYKSFKIVCQLPISGLFEKFYDTRRDKDK